MNALDVKNLTKKYPSFLLDRVSFSVGCGKVVGLIGRNGAGKSTALKGIVRLISAEGEVLIFGKDISKEERACKEILGFVGGGFRFYSDKKVSVVGKAVSDFYANWDNNKFFNYLSDFGIDLNKKIRELSEGMKVKFSLALAMSHGAKLLILDEPTSGLDPVSREEFCDIILDLVKNEGVSVLFSTHVTSDLMRISDDIVYLSNGKVLLNERLKTVLNEYSVARFSDLTEIKSSEVIGVKPIKDGYEGLIKRGVEFGNTIVREANLDDIMVHFERENSERSRK